MAGVKSLLKAAANDMEQTTRAQIKSSEVIPMEAKLVERITETSSSEESSKKATTTKMRAESKAKNLGGRPTNKEKGIKSRKQYTLTLKEEDHDIFLNFANKHDMSFAKFLEKAAFEYIENHQ